MLISMQLMYMVLQFPVFWKVNIETFMHLNSGVLPHLSVLKKAYVFKVQ